MLARLDSVAGLHDAAVDHRGELLRLVVSDANVLDVVRGELSDLDYAAEGVSGITASDVRWYAFDDVRDLSREEAEIIARRVTSAFRRSRTSATVEGPWSHRTPIRSASRSARMIRIASAPHRQLVY